MRDPVTADERRLELYHQIWRQMRIPATIEVFDAAEVAPAAWAAAKQEHLAASQWDAGAAGSDARDLGTHRLCTVLNAVVREQNFNTAVSFVPSPGLPLRSEPDQPAAAARYMGALTALTEGVGPVALVKAVPGSNVVTTDL